MKNLKKDLCSYHVSWSDEDQEFLGLCSEFPSLSWLDPSPEGALKGIRAVVGTVIENMESDHEPDKI